MKVLLSSDNPQLSAGFSNGGWRLFGRKTRQVPTLGAAETGKWHAKHFYGSVVILYTQGHRVSWSSGASYSGGPGYTSRPIISLGQPVNRPVSQPVIQLLIQSCSQPIGQPATYLCTHNVSVSATY
jgi:hypothetical protein